jgi:hypothetical protein
MRFDGPKITIMKRQYEEQSDKEPVLISTK